MNARAWMLLPGLGRSSDLALLIARLGCGSFLIYQSHDNVLSAERMAEFVGFLEGFGFWQPRVAAVVSVYAQFLAGWAFVLGALTRWFGIVTMINFLVALAMVHWGQDFPLVWPALALVLLSAVFATVGAGRFSVDHLVGRAAPSGTLMKPEAV